MEANQIKSKHFELSTQMADMRECQWGIVLVCVPQCAFKDWGSHCSVMSVGVRV